MMAGEKRQMTSGSKAVKTAAVTSAAPQNFEKNPAQPRRQEIGPAALYKAACIYLSLPLFIFLGGWLDGGWAALFLLLTATAFYKMYTGISCQTHLDASTQTSADISCKTNAGISADEAVNIPSPFGIGRGTALGLLALAAGWCFFAGIGYFYYQSFDYHFRNAVFRDLISYDWPVFYDKADTPLVYYMGFWLVPAALAKLSAPLIQNAYINFLAANIYLYIYAVIGTALIFMLLAAAAKARGRKQVLAAALAFVLFSGLDIIGIIFFRTQPQPFAYHLDWWATFIQYSSFSTGMFWVFNQFIPTALLTLLIFNGRNIRHFGFLIALALFFAPYPAAGIGIFMIAYAGKELLQSKCRKLFIAEEIFSVPNIVGVFWLLPLLVLYFMTNTEGMDKLWYVFDYTTPLRLIIFMILEFLLYAAILAPSYCRNVFFTTAVLSLCLIPFFRLDEQNNFCMRASIPALIILSVYVIRFLLHCFHNRRGIISGVLLILLLAVGSATPLTEFYRGIHYTRKAGRLALTADEIYTLNKPFVRMPVFGWSANHQFTAKNYRTDIFWQFLATKNRTEQ